MTGTASTPRCPVCNARRRPVAVCGRCGADLEELQRIDVAAWRSRREAWQRLLAGDTATAAKLARSSLALAESPSARSLEWLLAVLRRSESEASR